MYDSRIDQKIAEELIIGLQTVSTHVGDIPNKTGAANKTEAVDYANQPGLVEANSEGGEQSPGGSSGPSFRRRLTLVDRHLTIGDPGLRVQVHHRHLSSTGASDGAQGASRVDRGHVSL